MNISAFKNNNPIWQTAVICKICRIAITQPWISRSCLNLVGWCGPKQSVPGEQKSSRCDFYWYFSSACKWIFTWLVNNQVCTLSPSFSWLTYVRKWQNCAVSTKLNPISQCSSVMQNWLNANRFIEKTEWPSSSPDLNLLDYHICWKSAINFSRSPRRLISWTSPCKPSGKSYGGELHQVLDCLQSCGYQWWSL